MGHGKITGIEREARLIELREAWFDGWVEGVDWALARTMYALRQGAFTTESVTSSVVEHLGPRVSRTSRRPLPGSGSAGGRPYARVGTSRP